MSSKSKIASYFSYLMLAVFLLSAAVQYNDPDPLLWIGIYAGAALLTWLFIREQLLWMLPASACILLLVWAGFQLQEVWGIVSIADLFESIQMQDETVEIAREAGGLLIIAAWMLYLGWSSYRKRSGEERPPSGPALN